MIDAEEFGDVEPHDPSQSMDLNDLKSKPIHELAQPSFEILLAHLFLLTTSAVLGSGPKLAVGEALF